MGDGPHPGTSEALNDYLFDTCGYLKCAGHVGEAEVAVLRAQLTPHWEKTRSSGTQRIRNLLGVSNRFLTLADQLPQGLSLYRYINQPYRLIESYALHRSAGSRLDLHNGFSQQQVSRCGSASRSMWRHHTYHDGKTYCMMIKVLLYLTDVQSREDGPFCLIDGSHKANYSLPLTSQELEAAIATKAFPSLSTVHVNAGDVIVINEALMHGTLPKTSNQPRIVLAFSYAPRFVADYDETPSVSESAISRTGFYR